jgi:hypothetical protein
MTEEQIALARRAVACRGWRWMPGMLIHAAGTAYRVPDRDHDPGAEDWWRKYTHPDFQDPATLGCLLALVREAHGPRCYTQACGGFWTVQNEDTEDWWGKNCVYEAEALVAALEAAP